MTTQNALFSEAQAPSDATPTPAELRNRAVRKVLEEATEPLGPTEIARRVNEEWCAPKGGYPLSAAITPICRRMGLKSVNGKYQLLKPESE